VKRIAIGEMHPAPYRQPVLDRICSAGAFDVDVFSNRAIDVGHAWAGFGEADRTLYRGNGVAALFRALKRYVFSREYDLVCWSAYYPFWLTLPLVLSALLGKKYALALDSVREEGSGRFGCKIKELIFGRACFLWVPGLASRRFLENDYGIAAEKIVEGAYALEKFDEHERLIGVGGLTFLMVCNNVPWRRVDVVIEGFVKFAQGRTDVRLMLCGKGMSAFAGRANVDIVDGCPWDDLPKVYAHADIYVHNGTEQFSTAVLMAAMRGMPIVVGREVGVVQDLFEGGAKPGICVDRWQSPDAWVAAFQQIISMRDQWHSMGQIGQLQSKKFDVRIVSESLVAKIREYL